MTKYLVAGAYFAFGVFVVAFVAKTLHYLNTTYGNTPYADETGKPFYE